MAAAPGGPAGLPGDLGDFMGGSGNILEGPGDLGGPGCPQEPKNGLRSLLALNPSNTPG